MKKADIILVAAVLAVFGVFCFWRAFAPSGENLTAEVYVNGEMTAAVDISQNRRHYFNGAYFPFVLECRDGAVAVIETPCPNQICVKTGFAGKNGFSIVCVPNKVSILIKGGERDIDALSR
jgi:hypothetical protein